MNVTVDVVSTTRLCSGLLYVIVLGWTGTTLSEFMFVLLFNVVFQTSHFFWVALLRGFIQSLLPPSLLSRVASSLCPFFLWEQVSSIVL